MKSIACPADSGKLPIIRYSFPQFLLIPIVFLFHFVSQAQELDWTHLIQRQIKYATCMDVGEDNITYSGGNFGYIVDFDPGPEFLMEGPDCGDLFGYIKKIDNDGEHIWTKAIGSHDGYQNVRVHSLQVTPEGDIVIVGWYRGSVDMDPGLDTYFLDEPALGHYGLFILKLDSDGNFLWARKLEDETGNSMAHSVTVDNEGNYLITGEFDGTANFDLGGGVDLHSSVDEEPDVFVLKLDSEGNTIWAKTFGGYNVARGRDIDTDEEGNIYTLGIFKGTSDFDPDPDESYPITNETTWEHVFIQKLNADGEFIWAKAISSTVAVRGYSGCLDEFGNYYATGDFAGTADFDCGPDEYTLSGTAYWDTFVLKLNSSGDFEWVYHVSGNSPGSSSGVGIAINNYNELVITGNFTGEDFDFDNGPDEFSVTAEGFSEIFLFQIDSDGNFNWAGKLEGVRAESKEVAIGSENEIFITGQFMDDLNFGLMPGEDLTIPAYEDYGMWDCFTAKYSGCRINDTIYVEECDYYVSESGEMYDESGIYLDNIFDIGECDSAVYLNVTIHNDADISIEVSESVLHAVPTGVTYQWVDCLQEYEPIPGATGQDFYPASDGEYAVIITNGSCIDTSDCVIFGHGVSGLNDLSGIGVIEIFPNPTNGEFTLTLKDNIPSVEIEIKNVIGQTIHQQIYQNTNAIQLNIDGESGVYLLYLKSFDGELIVKKVVKHE